MIVRVTQRNYLKKQTNKEDKKKNYLSEINFSAKPPTVIFWPISIDNMHLKRFFKEKLQFRAVLEHSPQLHLPFYSMSEENNKQYNSKTIKTEAGETAVQLKALVALHPGLFSVPTHDIPDAGLRRSSALL